MTDLFLLMSKLVTPKGEILVPGLSELVAPLTEEEKSRYNALDYSVSVCESLPGSLTSVHMFHTNARLTGRGVLGRRPSSVIG